MHYEFDGYMCRKYTRNKLWYLWCRVRVGRYINGTADRALVTECFLMSPKRADWYRHPGPTPRPDPRIRRIPREIAGRIPTHADHSVSRISPRQIQPPA